MPRRAAHSANASRSRRYASLVLSAAAVSASTNASTRHEGGAAAAGGAWLRRAPPIGETLVGAAPPTALLETDEPPRVCRRRLRVVATEDLHLLGFDRSFGVHGEHGVVAAEVARGQVGDEVD